jgi:hypothetical protein
VDVKPRCSPTVVALACLAFTVSLTRGLAFAADGGQDLSQAIASATRAVAMTVAPASTSPTPAASDQPMTLNWPQASSWPLTFAGPVTLTGAPPQAIPREFREPTDGHGFAKTVAGVSTGLFVLLQGVDIAQTMQCIGAASCREANPFLRSLARQPAAFGATKMAIAFVSGYTLFHARTRHPKLVTALSIAGIGLYATITYRQAQLNRR